MIAIHALNRAAFINGDRNRLKLGQTLILPTAAQLGVSVSPPVAAQSAAEQDVVRQPQTAARDQAALTDIATEQEQALADQASVAANDGMQARLRIEETDIAETQTETGEMRGRLTELESRFNVMLSELDDRDRKIASLQAELDVLRAAREAENEAAVASAAAVGTIGLGNGGVDASANGSDEPAAGAVSADVLPAEASDQPESSAQSSSWFSWWSLPLIALAFLLGWVNG